ncbi:MAG: hypothetical protein ACR2H1_04760, partial [Limisphaerales bacterium]
MKTNLLKIIGGLLFIAATSSPTFATDPSSSWNVYGQARTDSCAPMKYSTATLLFPDATPTGFYARADDPSKNIPCSYGYVEIDAQEILYTGAAQDLYFHPGGGGSYYNNELDNGQYGHIWVADLNARPTLRPQNINGNGCSASTVPGTAFSYYLTPTRIPSDMYYKPVAEVGGAPRWWTYGDPGYDKTGGRGDWTYIVWSCVQTGSGGYPDNSLGGGGLVRALGKRDKVFHRCDISKIYAVSYADALPRTQNGNVTNIYGKTRVDATGSWVYGWLVHS